MNAYRLTDKQFDTFVENLVESQSVVGPVERSDQPGFYRFDRIDTPGALVRHYTTTTLPPKSVFFPPQETVFILQFEAGGRPRIEPQWRQEPFVLFGLHPCDLAAVEALDLAYGFPPAEVRWGENRKKTAIIGIDCRPDDYCFCTSMGTEASRAPCDLFFTPIEDSWIAEVHSPIGALLLSDQSKKPATTEDRRAQEDRLAQKRSRIRTQLNASAAQFADILAMGGLTPIWQQTAERCYSCGSCNTTCPTCFCFSMADELDLDLRGGRRLRRWDSCQLLDFARVAGGENFRAKRWQRVRHRWHRKFLYLYNQFGRPFCTGCGRCSRACTADINIVDVSNELIAHFQKETSA